jgi:hypothetical protein
MMGPSVPLAAPLSFATLHVAPLLPEFFAAFPEISIDLHVSDASQPIQLMLRSVNSKPPRPSPAAASADGAEGSSPPRAPIQASRKFV